MSTYYAIEEKQIKITDFLSAFCGQGIEGTFYASNSNINYPILCEEDLTKSNANDYFIEMDCELGYYLGFPMSLKILKSHGIYDSEKDDIIVKTKPQRLWINHDGFGNICGFVRYGNNVVDDILLKIEEFFDINLEKDE